MIETKDIEPEGFDHKPTPPPIPKGDKPKKKEFTMSKSFSDTRVGRVLSGKNKVGRILHAVIDVLPVPNVHEIFKKVIKDDEERKVTSTFGSVIVESLRRLDYLRTIVAVTVAVVLVKGSDWLGIELSRILDVFERLIQLF